MRALPTGTENEVAIIGAVVYFQGVLVVEVHTTETADSTIRGSLARKHNELRRRGQRCSELAVTDNQKLSCATRVIVVPS